jgi:hypothetical protein
MLKYVVQCGSKRGQHINSIYYLLDQATITSEYCEICGVLSPATHVRGH